jgi:hypothetical protein
VSCPAPARGGDISAALFVGVYRFFYGEAQAADRPPQGAQRRGRRQGIPQFRQRGVRPRYDERD